MVFNWFRRKFDKSESEQVQDSEQVETPAVVEDEPTEPDSEAVATDYLAWAKAAYQNIQQQSSVAVVEADETSSDESAIVETTERELLKT